MPETSRLPFIPGRPRSLHPPQPKPHHPMHASARSPEQVANETSFESPALSRVRCAEGPLQQGTSAKFAAPPTAGFIEGHMLCTWASYLSITDMDPCTDACMHRRKERHLARKQLPRAAGQCAAAGQRTQRRSNGGHPSVVPLSRHSGTLPGVMCCGVLWCVVVCCGACSPPLLLYRNSKLILCHLPPPQRFGPPARPPVHLSHIHAQACTYLHTHPRGPRGRRRRQQRTAELQRTECLPVRERASSQSQRRP